MAAAGIVEVVGRAERNKRDKRARLIAAARELFRTKGFEQTTTSEIAERADVGKGTLFFHARSKDELLVMVFQEDMGRTIDRAFSTVPEADHYSTRRCTYSTRCCGRIARTRAGAHLCQGTGIRKRRSPRNRRRHREAFFSRMSILIERAQGAAKSKRQSIHAMLAYNMFALHFSFLVVWLGSGLRTPDPSKPSMRQMLELQLLGLLESPAVGRPGES